MEIDFENPIDEIRELEEEDIKYTKEKGIEKLDTGTRWKILKKLSEKYYNNKTKFKIFVSKEVEYNGKITHKLFEDLKQISLIKETNLKLKPREDSNGDLHLLKNRIIFFDEELDGRSQNKIVDSFNKDFWFYKFKTENKEYIVLTDEKTKLDIEEYTIYGTLINLPDFANVGNYSKILLENPIILLHSAKKRISKFNNNKEFFDEVKRLGINQEDKLKQFVFSNKNKHYNNPKEFEDLLLAVLFSCPKDNYPLHILGIGAGGCGKSTTLEGLHSKSGETNIFEGTTSTFKALIPSYKSNIANIGHIFESNRFCLTDEFLRLLIRVDKDDRSYYLTFLNDILEHKKRLRSSGNCGFNGKMTSKFVGFTNPIYKTKNIVSLLNRFEESITTFSRMIIFYYDKEHLDFVNNLKSNKDILDIKPTDKNDFLSIYDYINKIECSFDNQRVKEIFDKFKGYLKSKEEYLLTLNMYESRYYHHLECLLDGIIKIRCLLENDNTFKAKIQDYSKLANMVKFLLEGWGISIIDEIKM